MKNNPNFDVTMRNFDGAELCDLVYFVFANHTEKLIWWKKYRTMQRR